MIEEDSTYRSQSAAELQMACSKLRREVAKFSHPQPARCEAKQQNIILWIGGRGLKGAHALSYPSLDLPHSQQPKATSPKVALDSRS